MRVMYQQKVQQVLYIHSRSLYGVQSKHERMKLFVLRDGSSKKKFHKGSTHCVFYHSISISAHYSVQHSPAPALLSYNWHITLCNFKVYGYTHILQNDYYHSWHLHHTTSSLFFVVRMLMTLLIQAKNPVSTFKRLSLKIYIIGYFWTCGSLHIPKPFISKCTHHRSLPITG